MEVSAFSKCLMFCFILFPLFSGRRQLSGPALQHGRSDGSGCTVDDVVYADGASEHAQCYVSPRSISIRQLAGTKSAFVDYVENSHGMVDNITLAWHLTTKAWLCTSLGLSHLESGTSVDSLYCVESKIESR